MYSDKPRCRYGANQLAEVICQFYFPEILAIGANPPVEFQEAIRQQYPRFQRRMEIPAPKSWVGKTLKELNVRAKLGINILANGDYQWYISRGAAVLIPFAVK